MKPPLLCPGKNDIQLDPLTSKEHVTEGNSICQIMCLCECQKEYWAGWNNDLIYSFQYYLWSQYPRLWSTSFYQFGRSAETWDIQKPEYVYLSYFKMSVSVLLITSTLIKYPLSEAPSLLSLQVTVSLYTISVLHFCHIIVIEWYFNTKLYIFPFPLSPTTASSPTGQHSVMAAVFYMYYLSHVGRGLQL